MTVIFATVTVHPASKPWQIKGFIKLATDERRGGNYPWREFAFNPAAYSGSDIFFFFFQSAALGRDAFTIWGNDFQLSFRQLAQGVLAIVIRTYYKPAALKN